VLCILKSTSLSRLLDMPSIDLIIAPEYVTRPSNLANADHDCVVLVTRGMLGRALTGSPIMTRHLRYPIFLIMLLGYVSVLLPLFFRSRSRLLSVRFRSVQ
jgi:hypothetical protein